MNILMVIPAHNEEEVLQKNISQLYKFLKLSMVRHTWRIVISDNNSTDRTRDIAQDLSKQLAGVLYHFVSRKGKGAAIRSAWMQYEADIYCFMDADLSTDLSALPSLIRALADEGFDMACGSRFLRESRVYRSITRKIASFAYHFVLRLLLGLQTKDAPCGFKAVKKTIRDAIVPKIQSNEWFFDSELVILSEKFGYTIKEIPIIWHDTPQEGRMSQVKIASLGLEYIRNVLRVRKALKDIALHKKGERKS